MDLNCVKLTKRPNKYVRPTCICYSYTNNNDKNIVCASKVLFSNNIHHEFNRILHEHSAASGAKCILKCSKIWIHTIRHFEKSSLYYTYTWVTCFFKRRHKSIGSKYLFWFNDWKILLTSTEFSDRPCVSK